MPEAGVPQTVADLLNAGYQRLPVVYKQAGVTRMVAYSRLKTAGLYCPPHVVFTGPKIAWASPKAAEFLLNDDLKNFIPVTEVERLAGVPPGTVFAWMKRGNCTSRQYLVRHRKAFLSDNAAWKFLESNSTFDLVPEKPDGWRSIKWLTAETGLSRTHWLKVLHSRPELTVVQTRRLQMFVHPRDAEQLRLEALSARPVGKWIPLATLAREFSRPNSSVHVAAKRLGIETRWFRLQGKQLEKMVSPTDADKLREWSASARRFKVRSTK